MSDPHTFMQRAIELAARSIATPGGGPFGAVVVYQDQVIGEGWNQVTLNNDPTAHAEVQAIRAACSRLGTFSLAGAQIFSSCEPCPMCLAAIYWARLAKMWFAATREDAAQVGFDDELLYRELPLPIAERRLATQQLDRAEGARVLQDWFSNPARVKY